MKELGLTLLGTVSPWYYLLAAASYLYARARLNRRVRYWAYSLFLLALLAHTSGMLIRTLLAGRLPLASTYEALLLMLWSGAALSIYYAWRRGMSEAAELLGTACAVLNGLALLGAAGLPLDREIRPLVAILRSNWLFYHVLTVMTAYGAFLLAFGLGIAYLLLERRSGGASEKLSGIEELSSAVIRVGFFFLTLGILTGAVWAEQAWGRYWGWDPKETWALVTWIIYALYPHLRMTAGLRARGAALYQVAAFAAVLFTYFGVNYLLAGLHSYA